jgi:alginate lyase
MRFTHWSTQSLMTSTTVNLFGSYLSKLFLLFLPSSQCRVVKYAVEYFNKISRYAKNLLIAVILISILNQINTQALSTSINSEDRNFFKDNKILLDKEKLPPTIILDPYVLLKIKVKVTNHDDLIIQEFLQKLLEEASSFLTKKPLSVTEKPQLPPSGNKHDFYSLAAYEWPNPDTPDGLPYVPRDGEINPEIYTISDKKNMKDMVNMVRILSLAYYFTDDTKYAVKAQELLRVWFLDESTYMNPDLKYAETIRGKNELRPQGIMEGRILTELTDAIRLLQSSPQWTSEMQQGLEDWFNNYLDWLLNSESGKEEGSKMNNHGTYFTVQVSSIALFLNKTDFTKEILQATMQDLSSASLKDVPRLIAVKILSDGRQPFELRRANSLDYSLINLLGLATLANIGERVGLDLWNHDIYGAGIQKALDYLLPYIQNKEDWPYTQNHPVKDQIVAEVVCQGILHYKNNESYLEVYRSSDPGQIDNIYYPICNMQ